MIRYHNSKFFIIVVLGISLLFAKTPVRSMQPTYLGIEYSMSFRGQTITSAMVNSHEKNHILRLSWSPVEYIQFSAGGGVSKLYTDEYNNVSFDGDYGFTPEFTTDFNSPAFINNIVRITAGFDILHFISRDDNSWEYSTTQFLPSAGLLFSFGDYVDLEVGALGDILWGTMIHNKNSVSKFSNNSYIRGYMTVTAISPNGAFGEINFNASENVDPDMSNGPIEASVGFSIGVIIKSKKSPVKKTEINSKYFPAYKSMKKRLQEMEEEISN